jgi:hypothetical protein
VYHGYNCFVPAVRQRNIIEQNERRTNASCSHPANRSAHNQLVHILCNRTDQRARLENGNVPYEDPLGGENAQNLAIKQVEDGLGEDEGGHNLLAMAHYLPILFM